MGYTIWQDPIRANCYICTIILLVGSWRFVRVDIFKYNFRLDDCLLVVEGIAKVYGWNQLKLPEDPVTRRLPEDYPKITRRLPEAT